MLRESKYHLALSQRRVLKADWGTTPLDSVPLATNPRPNPTEQDVPNEWATAYLAPGRPFTPFEQGSFQDRLAQSEPRSFQYVPYINANISPRIAYGLMPFSQLMYYRENVPEVAQCVRLITQELNSFVPHVYNDDGERVTDDPAVLWMTQYPDRVNPFHIWIAKFLDGFLTYDAAAIYRVYTDVTELNVAKAVDGEEPPPIVVTQRNPGAKVGALRIIDGSTLYLLIDERGEMPKPPAPAFTQIIWGTPLRWYNSEQIWYRPRNPRINAPYGRSPIEDALVSIQLLANMWLFENNFFTEGTMPESWLVAPQGWNALQSLAFEKSLNDRMTGNLAERRRMRVLPYGMKPEGQKNAEFRETPYEQARKRVFLTFGVPPAEMGETPRQTLGGRGYMEAMSQIWYRAGIANVKRFIEGLFNEVLDENGYSGYQFVLDFPSESLDPAQQEMKFTDRWEKGLASRDETRQAIGMTAVGGEVGSAFLNPRAIGVAGAPSDMLEPNAAPKDDKAPLPEDEPPQPDDQPPIGKVGQVEKPAGAEDLLKHCGVCPEDDAYYGAPITRGDTAIPMPHQGANDTEVVSVKPDGYPPRAAVWKPEGNEEEWMRERVGGELAPREEAAYLLDRALELYLVPVAYRSVANGEHGAVMLYVPGADGLKAARPTSLYDPQWIERAGAFDCLISQLDRHEANNPKAPANYLTHPDDDKRMILIDNGLSMPDEPKLIKSPFYDAWEGKTLSPELADALAALKGNTLVWNQVRDLVGSRPVELAQARLRAMVETGTVAGESVYLEYAMKAGIITPSEYAALKEALGEPSK